MLGATFNIEKNHVSTVSYKFHLKIYEYSQHEYKDRNNFLKRSVSCFSKVYALHESGKVKMKQKIVSNIKV